MGYLLPIQSIQSQQYADRMHMNSNRFTKIDRTEKVNATQKIVSRDFSGQQHHLYRYDDQEKERIAIGSTPSSANLSPELAQSVGKGLMIDRYV